MSTVNHLRNSSNSSIEFACIVCHETFKANIASAAHCKAPSCEYHLMHIGCYVHRLQSPETRHCPAEGCGAPLGDGDFVPPIEWSKENADVYGGQQFPVNKPLPETPRGSPMQTEDDFNGKDTPDREDNIESADEDASEVEEYVVKDNPVKEKPKKYSKKKTRDESSEDDEESSDEEVIVKEKKKKRKSSGKPRAAPNTRPFRTEAQREPIVFLLKNGKPRCQAYCLNNIQCFHAQTPTCEPYCVRHIHLKDPEQAAKLILARKLDLVRKTEQTITNHKRKASNKLNKVIDGTKKLKKSIAKAEKAEKKANARIDGIEEFLKQLCPNHPAFKQ